MKKKLIFLGLSALLSGLYAKDSDLDGVPDNIDICPNTSFLEIVNKYGCSVKQIQEIKKNKIKFNIGSGYEYDNYKNSKSSNLFFSSISAQKNNFKLALYYSVLDNGYNNGYKSNDLITSFKYYNYSLTNTALKFELKAYLPTYYNNKTDYAFLIGGTYFFNNFDIGISEKHKIYGESNTNPKDTITAFADFPYKKLSISPYTYIENSAYDSSTWYKYAGITLLYQASKKIEISIDSSMDLEENQNYTINGSINYNF